MQLHKRDVVDKATEILDTYGIADLTMRRLARELDVTPGALYWHFASKQELLGAVADRVLQPALAALPGPATPNSWRSTVVVIGDRLRDALLSHTDGAELVSASFSAGQSAALAQILAELAGAATDAGVAPGRAELAARTVLYYVLGFTVDEQSRMQWDAAGALAAGQSVLEPAADGAGGVDTASSPGEAFAFGLELLIDGMATRRSTAIS